jgi:hypothetical protein
MYQINQLVRFYNPISHIFPPDIKDYNVGLIISINHYRKKNAVYRILYRNKTLYAIDEYIRPID